MTPPPIRYPLPTLILVIAVTLAIAYGERWSRPARQAVAARLLRLTEGPPVPASSIPRRIAGSLTERVLLLRDSVPYSDRPGGPEVGTIPRRQFLDVYDRWPIEGPTTHFRVGNRSPRGWVSGSEVLPWSTRLVLTVAGGPVEIFDSPQAAQGILVDVGPSALPVLDRRGDFQEVAIWDRARPWSTVVRTGWVKTGSQPRSSWGVLLSRDELTGLIRRSVIGEGPLRFAAAVGRTASKEAIEPGPLREHLPPLVFEPLNSTAVTSLLDWEESQRSEAEWSGIEFIVVPLQLIP